MWYHPFKWNTHALVLVLYSFFLSQYYGNILNRLKRQSAGRIISFSRHDDEKEVNQPMKHHTTHSTKIYSCVLKRKVLALPYRHTPIHLSVQNALYFLRKLFPLILLLTTYFLPGSVMIRFVGFVRLKERFNAFRKRYY